jgi:hypothetical protein
LAACSSVFSSAFARITFLAAAFTAVSVLAASSLEDGGDAEPNNDGELDGPPVLSFDRVPPRRIYRGR